MNNVDFEKITEIGKGAIEKAKAINKKNDLPNIFCKDGEICFELSMGQIIKPRYWLNDFDFIGEVLYCEEMMNIIEVGCQ